MRLVPAILARALVAVAALSVVLTIAGCDFDVNGEIPLAKKHVHVAYRNGAPPAPRAPARP